MLGTHDYPMLGIHHDPILAIREYQTNIFQKVQKHNMSILDATVRPLVAFREFATAMKDRLVVGVPFMPDTTVRERKFPGSLLDGQQRSFLD